MRNLKKVLSLALAMVMLLGMMVVGAGATSFKDDGEIQNKEAVEVVSAIGILTGVGDNTFAPKGTLTRAEAAVVIAKLDLGAAFGNLATTNASTFKDVGTGYGWAKPYIDYCAARGLIAGDGNGYFHPADDVTGVQFALMVARVLGYEDKAENMGGTDWEVKAAALARKADLTINVTLGSQAMTRDEMAQVAYNALTADMVYYRTPGTEINTGNGGSVIINGTPAEARSNNGAVQYDSNGTVIYNDATLQLCEEKFPNLTLRPDTDDFQRDVYTWYNARDEIGSYQMDEPAFTYTAATTGSTVSSNLARYNFRDGGAYVYVNGNSATVGRINKAADKTGDPKDVVDSVAELTGNGVAVEIYANNDRVIEKIIVVNTYLMRVRQVSSTSVSLRTVTGGGFPVSAVGDTNDAFGVLSELKVDDYVMVVPVTTDNTNYTVSSAYVPETVSGALTRVDRNSSNNTTDALTVAGTAYSVAKNQAQIEGQPVLDSITNSNLTAVTKKDIGLYLDSYGYAVCAVDAVAATNYLYVMNVYQSLVDGRIVNLVEGVSTDGTVVTLNIGTSGNPSAGAAVANNLVSYTAASSTVANTYRAEYQLAVVDTVVNTTGYRMDGTTTTAPATVLSGIPYAGDVKFIFVNNGQVTVRDGVQNVTLTGGAQYKALVVKNGANNMVVSAVFVPSEPTDIGSNILYLSAFKGFTELNNTGAARYDAYIEGAKETIIVKGTNAGLAGAFYSYSKDEDLDLYTVNFYADSGNAKTGVATSARISTLTSASDIVDNRLVTLGSAQNLNAGSAVVTNLVGGFNVYSVRDIYDLLVAGRNVTVAAIYNDATGNAKKGTVEYLYVTAISAVGADAPLTKPTESNVTATAPSGSDKNVLTGTGASYTLDVSHANAADKTTGATVNLSGAAMTAMKNGTTGAQVAITTDIGTVTLAQGLFADGGKLDADNVKVTVAEASTAGADIPETEAPVLGFSIEVTADGQPVSGALGANITLVKNIPGLSASPKVYIVNADGTVTDVTDASIGGTVSYSSPNLTVVVPHLSKFVVADDKAPAATIPSDAKTVTVGATANVAVTKADSTATITATSSDTSKATVAVSGNSVVITGVAAGSATVTITVTAGDTAHYSNASQAVAVTVNAAAVTPATHTISLAGDKASEYTLSASSYTEGTAKSVTITAKTAGAKTGYTVNVSGETITPTQTTAGKDAVEAADATCTATAATVADQEALDAGTFYVEGTESDSGAKKDTTSNTWYKPADSTFDGTASYFTIAETPAVSAEDAVADVWTIAIPDTATHDITITVAVSAGS